MTALRWHICWSLACCQLVSWSQAAQVQIINDATEVTKPVQLTEETFVNTLTELSPNEGVLLEFYAHCELAWPLIQHRDNLGNKVICLTHALTLLLLHRVPQLPEVCSRL